jgi:hypothetical protein
MSIDVISLFKRPSLFLVSFSFLVVCPLHSSDPFHFSLFYSSFPLVFFVTHRNSKVEQLADKWITSSGQTSLSYAANGVSPITGGSDPIELLPAFDNASRRRHTKEGDVSLVRRENFLFFVCFSFLSSG